MHSIRIHAWSKQRRKPARASTGSGDEKKTLDAVNAVYEAIDAHKVDDAIARVGRGLSDQDPRRVRACRWW